jgi:hypothetical protein
MAFGGAQVNTIIGPAVGPLGLELSGVTLAANVGAFDLTAADSGAFTSDNTTTPANTNTIPAAFGPGEGNWTQAQVDAVLITLNHADTNANSRLGLRSKTLVGGNLVVNLHSVEAGAVTAVLVQLLSLHSAIQGR